MTARWFTGDTRKVLATLPENSVDLVLTSPPYLALRSYLPANHPDKQLEMGSEAMPGEFIDSLLDVVEAIDQVLAPHGSLCIELGDTYCGARGYGTEGSNPLYGDRADERWRDARVDRNFKRKGDDAWPEAKSLCMIPELFRVALVYGFNPLTGRTTPRWRVRNVVFHFRPNPPVGALGDKYRPATSHWIVACHARDRYFDLDAVRGDPDDVKDQRRRTTNGPKQAADPAVVLAANYRERVPSNPGGAPPLDWWDDDDLEWRDGAGFVEATAPYAGAHYATFSPKVVARLLKPMCPARVCAVCGKPSRRVVETVEQDGRPVHTNGGSREQLRGRQTTTSVTGKIVDCSVNRTVGWTDCGHDAWRRGMVLDPFAGSGTTLAVAVEHGRDSIGIDLNPANRDLAVERVNRAGAPLTVEDGTELVVCGVQERLL